MQVFIKIGFMLQAAQLIICHPKSKIYENFRTAIPRNKRNMFIAILLSFFITSLANFIYSELPNSIQAEAYSEPYQRFKMQFLAKMLTVREVYSERSRTSKMELFEKKIFSRPLFHSFIIYIKSSIVGVRLRSEYASETVNYFRKRLHQRKTKTAKNL